MSTHLLTSFALWQIPIFGDNSLSRVLRRNRLNVGLDASIGAPYLFWNSRTRFLDGFEWEIAREIATHLRVGIRPVNVPWADQPEQLRQQKFDIIISGREQGSLDPNLFGESRAYYRTSQRFLVRKDSQNINTLRDLIGRRIGVVTGSGGVALVETFNRNRGGAVRLFSSDNLERMLRQLGDRQLDALILDEPVAAWQAHLNPRLRLTGKPLLAINLVVVLNKNDISLTQAINQAIADLERNAKIEQILRRWHIWQPQPFSR